MSDLEADVEAEDVEIEDDDLDQDDGDSQPSQGNVAVLIACGLGSGYLKPGPGTWGTVLAFLIALCICLIGPTWPLQAIFIALAIISMILGLVVTPAAQRRFERLDPSQVVIDEIHGFWLALALLPSDLLGSRTVMVCVVAFVIFRLFDICKPWPIPILERTPGAWGVMLDDSLAGLLAGIATLVLVQ